MISHDMISRRARMAIAFAIVYFVWGSTYLAIRFAIETMPPFGMAGVRFVLAGTALFWLATRGHGARPTWRQWRNSAGIGALMFGAGNGLVCWAERTVPSGLASLVIATVPLWMTLLDFFVFRASRPTLQVCVGLILGFVGVMLLVDPAADSGGGVNPWGALALLMACTSWSFASLASRTMDLPESPFVTAAMQMLGGGVVLLVVSLFLGEWWRSPISGISLKSLAALGYLVVFGSMLALSAYTWLLRTCSPAMLSTYAYVNPVIAVLLGAWWGNEQLGARSLLAGSLIIVSVVVIVSQRSGRPAVPLRADDDGKCMSRVAVNPSRNDRLATARLRCGSFTARVHEP